MQMIRVLFCDSHRQNLFSAEAEADALARFLVVASAAVAAMVRSGELSIAQSPSSPQPEPTVR